MCGKFGDGCVEIGGGGDEVWYQVRTENYTMTKTGEIKCPAVYTITYKE